MKSVNQDFNHTNIRLMIDPDDNNYFLNLITLNKKEPLRIYLNMIDPETKSVKYPVIVDL